MLRYIIYAPDGIIRAVSTDLAIAQANLRSGESLLEWEGHVTATGYRVIDGAVVEVPPAPPTPSTSPGPRTR